jgi:signal transduction histidine kinase
MQDIDLKTELSETDWIENRSLRAFMEPRMRLAWLSAVTMVFMALQVYGHANSVLIGFWLLVSLVVVAFRTHVVTLFNRHFLNSDIASQSTFINKNQLAWTLNAFTWGVAGWLSFNHLPIQNQYISSILLTFVGFFAVHNYYMHRDISHQVIHILMGTQVIGAIWFIGYVGEFGVPMLQYIHLLGLIVTWSALIIFNNRLSSAFKRNLILQYRNNSLIRTLNLKTEQLAHEKQVAMNANEVVQRFYSSSAHDIRQPVYALKVYAEMAMLDATQLPSLLPKITASCDAINSLFDSLFDFEQINSGHINIAHQTVDIDEVIDDLEYQFKPLARHKNLEFRTNTISGYLQTDQLLVKRILTCFISNAVKYTEQGGILVTVRKRKSMVVFEVWDTGIGIDAAHLEHVFEEFYKVGDFSSTDEGFGLGLSVVKRLSAYAEGSHISVKSKIGVGSVFRFALPLKIYSPPYVQSRFDDFKALPLVLDHDLS